MPKRKGQEQLRASKEPRRQSKRLAEKPQPPKPALPKPKKAAPKKAAKGKKANLSENGDVKTEAPKVEATDAK